MRNFDVFVFEPEKRWTEQNNRVPCDLRRYDSHCMIIMLLNEVMFTIVSSFVAVLRSRRGSHPSQKSWYLWGPHRALDHVHGVGQGDIHQRRRHRRWRRVFSYMQLPLNMQSLLMLNLFMYNVIRVWINIYRWMWLVLIYSFWYAQHLTGSLSG